MLLSDIARVTGGKLSGKDVNVSDIQIDTRRLFETNPDCLFIALVGDRNGHDFLPQARTKKVAAALVSQPEALPQPGDLPAVVVPDTLKALQDLAAYKRQLFDKTVVGITGSNGKTVVKEWLRQLLNPELRLCVSPHSYNSQIGVAMSVWPLDASMHDLAIFEAGISQPGNMNMLERIIKPTIGVLTYFGDAHRQNFESAAQHLDEKFKLFALAHTLICPRDNPQVYARAQQWATETGGRLIDWSLTDPRAALFLVCQRDGKRTVISGQWGSRPFKIRIPFIDAPSVHNMATVMAVLSQLPVDLEVDRLPFDQLEPVANRLQLIQGIRGAQILNDAYSFDMAGLESVLNFGHIQSGDQPMTLILSDWLQGDDTGVYRSIARLAQKYRVTQVVGVGERIARLAQWLPAHIGFTHFADTGELIEHLPLIELNEHLVILKGARRFAFERIADRLTLKAHRTVLEINLAALAHNYRYHRRLIQHPTKLMCMVKASSYGAGEHEIAHRLSMLGADYLCVAYADEGIELRKRRVKLPIMVLNPEERQFDLFEQYHLEPEIYNTDLLYAAMRYPHMPIHIKLDTGMHRLGFLPHQIDELCRLLANVSNPIASVMSHLAGSETPAHDNYTTQQAALFDRATQKIAEARGAMPLRHLLNSAGIVRWPQYAYDMVRLGIGLYGIEVASPTRQHLQPVMALKATISQIKNLKAGDTVGYNRVGVLNRPTRLATVSIGYADGLRRIAGIGKLSLYVHGQPAPIVGQICMDMTMIDVTDIAQAQEGDAVEVFGQHQSIQQVAGVFGTIAYEVMTGISARVPRVFVEE